LMASSESAARILCFQPSGTIASVEARNRPSQTQLRRILAPAVPAKL
jgi:hypothetical protein